VDYRILGSFEIYDDGVLVVPGTGRQRALLALLLLRANETVPSETLVDELWDGAPPASATKILQNYVSRLRRALGDGVLVTRGRGYALRVESGEVDVERFERELETGRRALASNDPGRASATLQAALALWRGPPLVDFTDDRFARADIERLEELRLAALTERIEADLALGRHAELIGELEALASRYPFQERVCAQRMLALYRSGRQVEALEAYRELRHALVEELGIEPGASLQALERAILLHDPALELPRISARGRVGRGGRASRRRYVLAGGAAAVAVLVAVAVGVLAHRSGADAEPLDPAYSVGVIDPRSNRATDRVTVGLLPSGIATGAGKVWVLNGGETTVSKVDPVTRRVTRTIPLDGTENNVGATAIAFGDGAVWVGDGSAATVTRVSALGGSDLPVRVHPRFESDVLYLATGVGAVWVVSARRSIVYRLDPITKRITARVRTPADPAGVAVGKDAVWVASVHPATIIGALATSGALARIDPDRAEIISDIPLPFAPSGIAVAFGSIWVTANTQDAVLRIDPRTTSVERMINVGKGPTAVAASDDALWVVNARGRSISRIDPDTNAVVATIPVQGTPGAIASGEGKIWVTGA